MQFQSVRSFEDLVRFLRTWNQWGDVGQYDLNGAMHLLLALVQNVADAGGVHDGDLMNAFHEALRPEDFELLENLIAG